ncbi:cell division protein SepF [Candidatus Woesearchaeota archaeon]|nr:cell division protein SepF [Candidatus Woesearchaeota archaeon]
MRHKISKKGASDEEDFDEMEQDYVELDTEGHKREESEVLVKTFKIEDFSDIKPILHALREDNTIALIDIKDLKDKDLVELKRAINKLKKTTDAIDGDIAGFSEDHIVAVPSFAQIVKKNTTELEELEEE